VTAPTFPRPTGTCAVPADWRLVAPWYRWARTGGKDPGGPVRGLRPALHKYGTTDFVRRFLDDPRISVEFNDADRVQLLENNPTAKLPGDSRSRFLAPRRLTPGPTRKLFQPSHQRFYLVGLELHCDLPGYPKVDPGRVAEAGFVVRRHRVVLPKEKETTAARLLRDLATARAVAATRAGYEQARTQRARLNPFRTGTAGTDPVAAAHRRLEVLKDVEQARRRLQVWAAQNGIERRTEAWVVTEGRFGAWVPIEDTSAELIERSYPLRLLAPKPGVPDHPGALGTIYWAPVPTTSDEVGADGSARFSDAYDYEIRGWVRRDCGDCPGHLVWSEPSEAFGLASFHDPAGCAQHPTEIRLPDLRQLEASTATPSVRVSSPPGSGLSVPQTGDLPGEGSGSVNPNEQICFFSIPLFTIVAFFVFNLFLPILMLALGLWWMLKLKFCLPPSIELAGQLNTELLVVPGGISAAAGLDIDLLPGLNQNKITKSIKDGLDGLLAIPTAPPGGLPAGLNLGTVLTTQFTNDPILELLATQGYASPVGQGPNFQQTLAYTTPVGRDEVIHP